MLCINQCVLGQYADFKEYAELVNNRPVATIRDLLKLKQIIQLRFLERVEEAIYRALTLLACLWVHCLLKRMRRLRLR